MGVLRCGAATICLFISLSLASPTADQNKPSQKRIVFGEESYLRIADGYVGIWHMEPDRYLNGTGILFSWGSAIKTSEPVTIIAGSIDLESYAEGTGTSARFAKIAGFLQVTDRLIIVSDRNNHCIRSVDRVTGQTAHLAGRCTEAGYADGIGGDARFWEPSGITLDERNKQSLIVVDNWNNALRSYNMDTKQVGTIVQDHDDLIRPRFALFDNKDKNTLYVSIRFKIVKYSFVDNSITVIAGDFERLGYQDGAFDVARFSYFPGEIVQLDEDHLAVTDFWNQDVRLINMKLREVSSICEPKYNDSFVEGVGCRVDNPHGLMYYNNTLYVGDASNIIMMPVSFVDAGTSRYKCNLDTITARVQAGESKAKVEIGSHTFLLSPGKHQFMSEGCLVDIKVIGADTCPTTINRVVSPKTGKAVIDLQAGSISQQFELPVGRYPYSIQMDDLTCQFSINVYDYNMKRRVQFQADYDFECSSLNVQATKYLVESMVENNYIHMLEVCNSICKKDDMQSKPEMVCSNNMLSVFYPTNLVFNGDVTFIPQDIYDQLTVNLAKKGTIMSIVDTSKNPPVVFPRSTADGSSAKLVLTSYCLSNMTYDKVTDSCT